MKKTIISPDSFKGSLTSTEVANAIEAGVLKVFPNCETVKIPIADGGEGTCDTLVSAMKGEKVAVKVHDPLMRPIEVEYGWVEDGKTAIVEMAAASGITLLRKQEQNPATTTTFGTGEIIKDALVRGCRNFLIGIGGSATNDAGTGMLMALGYRFLDKNGKETDGTGGSLHAINDIDETGVMPELANAHFSIACDVNNPFCGSDGAAYVYATQKGADEKIVKALDDGMEHLRKLIESKKGIDLNTIAGAGAAGGLGGAFAAFLNAQLMPGIDMVLAAVQFEKHLQNADLVITGEGKLDKQTAMGKAANGVLRAATKANIPVIAIGGSVEDAEELNASGFLSVFSITTGPITLEEAMKKEVALRNVEQTVEEVMRVINGKLTLRLCSGREMNS